MMFDPMYFLFALPAMALALWAQARVSSTYAQAQQVPTRMSGAEAARMVLDTAGLQDVGIEEVSGHLSDHYDPSAKVLRLSTDVFRSRSAAGVGIAAHEAGHALQDAQRYAPLVIRNMAVPVANIGSQAGIWLCVAGAIFQFGPLVLIGIGLYSAVVAFQLVNLPVEFDASRRARAQLVSGGLITPQEEAEVGRVLNAAALTYVAATLTAVLTLMYFLFRAGALSRSGGR
jgi:Zn-dependent membrane protease YugP